ncbi:hypothetical protein AVEN_261709-1 [Araneus ventricosus]|uniref:Uncharacterized protein n=1 Tax=Araneus ventricosus TaxID=182803 RepID=A0A4Y2DXQ8_ARAVE|nr:hypothetical protein AVEN_261709-1 [Araneus ventricosus]
MFIILFCDTVIVILEESRIRKPAWDVPRTSQPERPACARCLHEFVDPSPRGVHAERKKRGEVLLGQELEVQQVEAGVEDCEAGREAAAAAGTPATTGVHQEEDDAHLAADLEFVANGLGVHVVATEAEAPLNAGSERERKVRGRKERLSKEWCG